MNLYFLKVQFILVRNHERSLAQEFAVLGGHQELIIFSA